MDHNHTLCLYVSYYLSRFNEVAYANLNFGNMTETHKRIGEILQTNPHTVKNMRDQFDPLHGFRSGWHQAPLSPSRASIVGALQDLSEPEIRLIVSDILNKTIDYKEKLLAIVSEDKPENQSEVFILRGPTGKQAEDFFIRYHSQEQTPTKGDLIDCRDLGCGYDFRIKAEKDEVFVEVKGLADFAGAILFTDKEWRTAKEKKEAYYLCIVRNLSEKPEIDFIQNPAAQITPQKNIYTTIQINWSVPQNQLAKLK